MTFMTWDESFSVNVLKIDLQHQKLIEMINEFYKHVGNNYGQALRTLINSLVEYTQYHFLTEEKYFRRFSYPDGSSHVEKHKEFTQKVIDVRNRLEQGKLVISFEITAFLRDWLTQHIKIEDKGYSKFFNDHGLS